MHISKKTSSADPWEPTELAIFCYSEHVKGRPQSEIGAMLNPPISRNAVHMHVRKVAAYLREYFLEDALDVRRLHIDRLEHIIACAMGAWTKSQQDAVSVTKSEGVAKTETGNATVEKKTTTKGQCGNVEYLRTAMDALQQIRKMLGINDAPERPPGSDETRVAGRPRDETIQAEIAKMQAALTQPGVN